MIKKLFMVAVLFSANAFAAPVNINTADAKTIADSLSGIGLKKAQAIVDYRAKNGNFASVDDLSKVTGIGAKTIAKNKADILLEDASSVPPEAAKQPTETNKTPAKDNKPVDKK